MIYVKFDASGYAVEMININPGTGDYMELPDTMMGKPLVKEGAVVRELTEEEHEALLLPQRISALEKVIEAKAVTLLKNSEALVLPDVWETYSKEDKEKISSYRTFLKTITKQPGYPTDLIWPELPVLGA